MSYANPKQTHRTRKERVIDNCYSFYLNIVLSKLERALERVH